MNSVFLLFVALLLTVCYSTNALGTKKFPPALKRQKDLVTSIETIKSDFDIPKANKEKIFRSTSKSVKKELFGFTGTSETINGRFAMIGFAAGIINEKLTGKSMLEQIGLTSHTQQACFLLTLAFAIVIVSIKYSKKG